MPLALVHWGLWSLTLQMNCEEKDVMTLSPEPWALRPDLEDELWGSEHIPPRPHWTAHSCSCCSPFPLLQKAQGWPQFGQKTEPKTMSCFSAAAVGRWRRQPKSRKEERREPPPLSSARTIMLLNTRSIQPTFSESSRMKYVKQWSNFKTVGSLICMTCPKSSKCRAMK